MDKNNIVECAREQLDIPYLHQGRNINGIDCVGLIYRVGLLCGYKIEYPQGYEQVPNPEFLYEGLEANLVRVDDHRKPSPGGILVIRFGVDPQHLAIFTGSTIIHAYERAGKVVEQNYSDVWKKRTLRAYSYE